MTNVMAKVFGSSPVMPVEQHSDIVYRCAKRLRAFFGAAVEGNWDKAAEARSDIEALENEADNLKKEIRLHLPKSLFMPVPREDVLELLLVQDKIANRARDVSGLVLGRKLQIPAAVAEAASAGADAASVRASAHWRYDTVLRGSETGCPRRSWPWAVARSATSTSTTSKSSAIASRRSARRATTTVGTPAAANFLAITSPIPDDAPVTSADENGYSLMRPA